MTTKMIGREKIAHEGLRIPAITLFLLEMSNAIDENLQAAGRVSSRGYGPRLSGGGSC
jgi:hypothetical protein